MTLDEKKAFVKDLLQGADLSHAQINVFVEAGSKVVYKEVRENIGQVGKDVKITDEQMVEVIMRVQKFFWAQSSWAVFFCVCRDEQLMPDNMVEFERYISTLSFPQELDYACTKGTVQRTISNHPFMKKPVDKWNPADMPRALKLAEELRAAFHEIQGSF